MLKARCYALIIALLRLSVKGGRFLFCYENKKVLILIGKIKTNLVGVARFELAAS